MGWSFKVHGGIAAGLSGMLLMLAALTWLPGVLPLTGAKWLMTAIVVLLFPVFVAALLRVLLARADRHSVWLAFRCLPRVVQGTLGVLAVSGAAVMLVSTIGEGNLQAPEIKGGRYFVLDTTPHQRGRVEVSESQYLAVLESDHRSMLTISGLLFAGASYIAFAAGELRRADVTARPR